MALAKEFIEWQGEPDVSTPYLVFYTNEETIIVVPVVWWVEKPGPL